MSANAEVVVGALREEDAQLYVINLCASTTPVALTQPNSPELKRYTFFVTRRREEGRERFRLHMGYFTSMDDAESLLADIREVYPAAWAGPAPGNSKPSPRMAAVPAPPKAPAAVATTAVATAVVESPVVEVPAAVVPAAPLELTLVEDAPRETRQASSLDSSLGDMSNVREVLAALDDAPAPKAAVPEPKPVVVKAAEVLRPIAAPQASPPPHAPAAPLTPKQELSLLESGTPMKDLDDSAIRMMTPEDTQTLRDIKLDTENKAPPCFAVQLMWSVTPIDMATLPQLAIFNAYTLYHVEGSRQGRRWYGVRLGFFTDVNAAKQVAYFMKADYSSVVVVPVTVKERARASDDGESTAASPVIAKPQAPAPKPGSGSFELLADDTAKPTTATAAATVSPTVQTPVIDPALDFAPVGMTPVTPVTATREAQVGPAPSGAKLNRPGAAPPARLPPQGGKKPTGKRVVARGRRAEPGQAAPLEETLELLGASTLTLDEDKKTVIDDSALRRSADAGKKKPGGLRFSKLLGRLSEKLGDSRR